MRRAARVDKGQGPTEEAEPWTAWAELPPGSDIAVRMGLVKPKPCPVCLGKGRVTAP